MVTTSIIMALVIVAVAGAAYLAGNRFGRKSTEGIMKQAEDLAAKVLEDARRKADTITREAELTAKNVALDAKETAENDLKEKKKELLVQEKRIQQKEENLDKKADLLDQKEMEILKKEQINTAKEQGLSKKEAELDRSLAEQRSRMEAISGMTAEEAKNSLLEAMESEARHDAARRIKVIEDEARETAEKKSKEIIAAAIQRYAGEYVSEKCVSVVPLPSDEMKGRIIGREGRNIRALEAATGIDLIIDDTPEAVILSGFNPVRREVARLSLEKLLADGRIHPGRIEEVVAKSEEEVGKGDQGGRRTGRL